MNFHFLHAADLHLDSPLHGLTRYPGAPVEALRDATRQALDNLVSAALEERVAFVLLAGDLFDGDWKDYNTGLLFTQQMRRLAQGGIPVFMVSGNHDAASRLSRSLPLPENVHQLAEREPETRRLPHLQVAIHGQSYPTRQVDHDLTRQFPLAIPGWFNIGLLHTSAEGNPNHATYAPCRVADLVGLGYDYWALGHVHQWQVLHQQPWVVFPGNVQGRHARETGPKGAALVRVEDGRITSVAQRPLDVLRWHRITVAAEDAADPPALLERVLAALAPLAGETLPAAVRLEISGPCPAHAALHADPEGWLNTLRTVISDAHPEQVWLEKCQLRTAPPRTQTPPGPLGELTALAAEWRADPEILAGLAREFQDLRNKLPLPLRQGEDPFDPTDPVLLAALLEELASSLPHQLLAEEERP